jgi:hypothetical protein
MKGLLLGIFLFIIAQSLIWIQTNGQFIWPWFKKNPLLLSIIGGTIISYIFIYATKYIAEYYGGIIWPGRFIAFSCGILIFTILTYLFLGEGVTIKTLVCLLLSITILAVQLLWK